MNDDLTLFAIEDTREFGEQVAVHCGLKLAAHEERDFEDGEHKIRPLESVRGRDVYVIQSLYSDAHQTVNDKLVRLLVFLGALRDASAARLTAVIPYLAYARKDKRTQPRDPVTTRYIAQIIESAGLDCVVTLDVHNLAAYQNAFRIRTEHLEAKPIFVDHFARELRPDQRVTVISPDAGGLKRAGYFRDALNEALGRDVSLGFMEKTRALGTMTAGELHADVKNATAIIIDDMISTGGTISSAAERAKQGGAQAVYAAASHGVFVGNAGRALDTDALDRVIVTDSVPPIRLPAGVIERRLTVLSCAPLFAAAIERLHTGGSQVALSRFGPGVSSS